MRHLTRSVAALAVAGSLALAAPATAAAPTIELKPGTLPRGVDVAVLHLEGHHTIVDGDRRIRTDDRLLSVLGRSGSAWLATSDTREGTRPRLVRVRPDGSARVLLRGPAAYAVDVSADGERVLSTRTATHGVSTRVLVYDARSADLEADRTYEGSVSVLQALGARVFFGGWGPNRTFRWNIASDTTRRISNRVGGASSFTDDRLATYTRDPYLGGCTVVSTLSQPSQTLWKSCDERVTGFAPGGQRMATVHILSDGIGPSEVSVRKLRGKKLASYTAQWFGAIAWEDATNLALYANGKKQAAWVRCDVADCERAGDLQPVTEG
jgi:hypothetical protein